MILNILLLNIIIFNINANLFPASEDNSTPQLILNDSSSQDDLATIITADNLTTELNQNSSASTNVNSLELKSTNNPNSPLATDNYLKAINDKLQIFKTNLSLKQNIKLPTIKSNGAIYPSSKSESLVQIKQILETLGYLTKQPPNEYYDIFLEQAVKKFQKDHSLEVDGIIAQETVACLNWSIEYRLKLIEKAINTIASITLNTKSIIINIPTFKLYALEDTNLSLQMEIACGRAAKKTPFLKCNIGDIIFNPIWHIPTSVFFHKLLPLIPLATPESYFTKYDISIQSVVSGHTVSPNSIKWDELKDQPFPYKLVQASGPYNSLGLIGITLPNQNDIMLHDTPEKLKFQTTKRAISAGCIHLQYASELVAWLLKLPVNEIVTKYLKDNKTQQFVKAVEPATVQVIYAPAWISAQSELIFGKDPYNLNPPF